MLYKQSVLAPHEYATIMNELQSTNLNMMDEKESSFATNRIGAQISKSSEIYEVLSREDGSLCRLVNSLADGDNALEGAENNECLGGMVLAQDVPLEVRVYEKTGAGMEWHIDDILYRPEQIEVVLTLENTSDCCTMWRPHDRPLMIEESGNNAMKYDVESAQTTPNSALILKAGGVEHKVSPLKTGKRTILKMAFVREGGVMDEGMEEHASHHRGGDDQMKKKKGSRKKQGNKKKGMRQKR